MKKLELYPATMRRVVLPAIARLSSFEIRDQYEKGMGIPPHLCTNIFHGMDEVDNFQLVEKSAGKSDLLLVPDSGAGLDKEAISQVFKGFFDANAAVKAFTVNSIKAEDGVKFRFVKSKSFAPLAQ